MSVNSSHLVSQRKYTCEEPGCSKAFFRDSHLKRHVKMCHTAERPYKWAGGAVVCSSTGFPFICSSPSVHHWMLLQVCAECSWLTLHVIITLHSLKGRQIPASRDPNPVWPLLDDHTRTYTPVCTQASYFITRQHCDVDRPSKPCTYVHVCHTFDSSSILNSVIAESITTDCRVFQPRT